MIKILHFLSNNRLLNIALCLIFYILVTLPHEFVGVSISKIFKGVSRADYNLTILVLSLLLLALFVFALFRQLKKLDQPKIPLLYFICCLLLMIVSLNLLIIVNIEVIHFFQYAVMAILLFPICRNFLATLLSVCLLGAVDEAYQYYYLSPERTNYYDINDVILNLLGAAMGLIFLRSHIGISELLSKNFRPIHRRSWILYFCFLFSLTVMMWQKYFFQKIIDACHLSFDWEGYGSVIIRKPTTGFWTEIPPKVLYHVVQPVEGIVVISILLFIFSFLNYKAE